MSPTVALLHRCSWQAEKLFRQRGSFRSMLWLTEMSDGHRERFETDCGASPEDASDLEVLTALVAEMRADFARDGVVRFAVAYPARAHGILNPLHNKPQTRAVDIISIKYLATTVRKVTTISATMKVSDLSVLPPNAGGR